MTVLQQGAVGSVGSEEIDFEGGLLIAKVEVNSGALKGTLQVSLSPKTVLDAMAAKMGGPIPAEVVAFLEAALKLN